MPGLGYLTPNQLINRLNQLFAEWHKLYLEEAFSTTPHNPNVPSRGPFEDYKRWYEQFGTFAAGFDVFLQGDTLKRLDEYRAIYEKERERISEKLGKEPQAMSTKTFGRPKDGLFDDIKELMKATVLWSGLFLLGYVAYDVYKDMRSDVRYRRDKERRKLLEKAAGV